MPISVTTVFSVSATVVNSGPSLAPSGGLSERYCLPAGCMPLYATRSLVLHARTALLQIAPSSSLSGPVVPQHGT